jgi:hypothetical protein
MGRRIVGVGRKGKYYRLPSFYRQNDDYVYTLLQAAERSFFLFGPAAPGKTTWRSPFFLIRFGSISFESTPCWAQPQAKLFRQKVEALPKGSWLGG